MASTVEYLAGNHPDPFFGYVVPQDPREGFWFLARRRTATGIESYDTCATSQGDARDDEIAASGVDCP